MSKSCCFAVALAAICLSVILLSLEAGAQPTIDETMTCGASTLEDVANFVKIIASNEQRHAREIEDEIKDVKTLLVSGSGERTNETRLGDVVREIKDEIRLLATNPIKCEYDAWEPSKQALVSALVCEYLVMAALCNRGSHYIFAL